MLSIHPKAFRVVFMDKFDSKSVDSPIAPLLPHVGGAPFFLAPERKKELLTVWTKHVNEIRA